MHQNTNNFRKRSLSSTSNHFNNRRKRTSSNHSFVGKSFPVNVATPTSISSRVWNSSPTVSSNPFAILTYNILAPTLVQNHSYLYKSNSSIVNNWGHRSTQICKELIAFNAEIICLQEVEEDYFDYLKTHLSKLNYMGYYQKRTSPDLMDGIAVFVSNQRFNVANIEYIKFGEVLKDDRHNVAILVTLQCVITKQFIVVSNTHLLWNPKRGDIKINQLDVLFNRIENILKLRRITHSSLIMTGDFNISVNSYIYNYIINGRTAKPSIPLHLMSGQKQSSTNDKSSSTQFPQKFHSFSLKSAYHPHHDQDGDFISTYHHDGYSLVDFIFYGSLQSEQTLLECVKVLKPPPIISLSQLPNDRFPSDHLPQIAYFGFISETTSSL